MKKIYLAGTVDKTNPEETLKRFSYIENQLSNLELCVLNPLRGKAISSTDMDFMPYEANEIVHRDENDVDRSDILFAYMLKPSIGTSMEIYRAREICKIPVVVVSDNPAIYKHYWIQNKATKIVRSIEEGIDFVQHWLL